MRITLDRGRCTGHGRCYTLSPDVFDADDDGYGLVRGPALPPSQQEAARRAVDSCPEDAIAVES